MPSTSKKQHNFMAAIAHSPSFAKKVGVPQSVGKDFNNADKGKSFKEGGSMKETMGPRTMSKDVEKGSNKLTRFGESAVQKRGKTKGKNLGDSGKTVPIQGMKKMAAGGFTRSADGIASKGKTKAKQVKMSYGGKC